MDDADQAAALRARARRVREESRKLARRAGSLPEGPMREMLTGQAAIMAEGADRLDREALALTPPIGAA